VGSPSRSSTTSNTSNDPDIWSVAAVQVVDKLGYRVSYEIKNAKIRRPARVNVTNAPPGQADWTPPDVGASIRLKNETTGRNAPVKSITVVAFWKLDHKTCALIAPYSYPDPVPISATVDLCPLASGFVGQGGRTLSAGEVRDVDNSKQEAPGVARMAEAQAQELTLTVTGPPDAWLAHSPAGFDDEKRCLTIKSSLDKGGTQCIGALLAQKGVPGLPGTR
jgi:hypothetical protein